MSIELRRFPRIKAELKIGYEFVKWNETKLDKLVKPNHSIIFDISVSGIGLKDLNELNKSLLHQLKTGKKKVRLEIFLYKDKSSLITFARLIWGRIAKADVEISRYGFIFLDVTNEFFRQMNIYVDKHLMNNRGG